MSCILDDKHKTTCIIYILTGITMQGFCGSWGGHAWFQHHYGFAHSISRRISAWVLLRTTMCVCVWGGGGGNKRGG